MRADRRIATAGLAALDGRKAEALEGYLVGLREHRAMGTRWELACTAIDMVVALGPDMPEVRAAAEEARAILAELGATPFVARLDAALARPADIALPPAGSAPERTPSVPADA